MLIRSPCAKKTGASDDVDVSRRSATTTTTRRGGRRLLVLWTPIQFLSRFSIWEKEARLKTRKKTQ